MKNLIYCLLIWPLSAITSDSIVTDTDYQQTVSEFYQLAEKHPQLVTIFEYGKSVNGLPLIAIRFGEKSLTSNQPRPALLATGVTHGHEYMNVVDQLPEWIRSEKQPLANFFSRGGLFYIIPIFNPDGYVAADRYNKNKVDLNRDFDLLPTKDRKFTQPETRLFMEFLEQQLSSQNAVLKYALSYHCCGRGDTGDGWGDIAEVGYPWAYTKKPMPENDLNRHKVAGEKIKKAFNNNRIVVDSWANILYKAQGVATDYYYAKYGTLSFVFEGMENAEKLRLSSHFSMWQQFAEDAVKADFDTKK